MVPLPLKRGRLLTHAMGLDTSVDVRSLALRAFVSRPMPRIRSMPSLLVDTPPYIENCASTVCARFIRSGSPKSFRRPSTKKCGENGDTIGFVVTASVVKPCDPASWNSASAEQMIGPAVVADSTTKYASRVLTSLPGGAE